METLSDHYAELHCLSNFTFLRGASHPEELIVRADELGYHALALTDECSLAGVVRAHVAARGRRIQLIIGSELTLDDGLRLVLLVTDRNAYGNLSELITTARRAAPKGTYRVTRDDIAQYGAGCLALLLPEYCGVADLQCERAQWLARIFPQRAWIAVELLLQGRDSEHLEILRDVSQRSDVPLVAAGDVHLHVRERYVLQDVLTAIRLTTPLPQIGAALFANSERHLRACATLARLYPQALRDATLHIAQRCTFSLDELRYEYPEELVPAGETPSSHLRKLTAAGMQQRWPQGVAPKVRAQIEHELTLIAELHYEPYFLTVHDIVQFARSRGILCQGRGSAANSAVCFCLGITEVDPARIETLFERFISKERNEPPDIDVDFEHERREEVIQYLYAKYGRERAALAATLITYQLRSAVRDVGKALGLTLEQVDRLARDLQWWDGRDVVPTRLREAGFDPAHPLIQHLVRLVNELLGFPRHLSQHVGGFVIARDKLSRLVPIENAAMAERTIIQWDKNDLDALGLLKVDCLALGMLTAIHRAFDLIAQHHGEHLTLANIPAEDPNVYAMIQQADTIGVFQIESRAQMAMLPRLKPACFYDLVIEVAIVRPGPIQGNMVHPYLRRRAGAEAVTYPSDAVRDVLQRTLGVPIFQEQVMKLAVVAAGFTPGEADQLRRCMAAWRRKGGLEKFEQKLIDGMGARGYAEEFARQIFAQIQGFGEYGFPESHAASFALLVYVSAWLKHYEPAAFTCALLNSQPMGFYAPAQLVQDARKHGVTVLPVDVGVSGWESGLEVMLLNNNHPVATRHPSSTEEGRNKGVLPAFSRPLSRIHALRGTHTSLCNGRDGCAADGVVGLLNNNHPVATRHPSSTEEGRNKEILPSFFQGGVDAQRTGWSGGYSHPTTPALRLGLNLISGLSHAAAQRIVQARAQQTFIDVEDLARRAQLNRRDLRALAEANALASLSGHRRHALWAVAGVEATTPLLSDTRIAEAAPLLKPPSEGENIVADYASLGLTLGRHPLAVLRPQLQARRLLTAQQLRERAHGSFVRTAGLVICRQHPSSANGVLFVTLEDETGTTNLVVWQALAQRQRRELLQSRLLGVTGEVQREGEVLHVIARKLVDYSVMLGALEIQSRDFH